jgi:membrane associated rhomboid family serine protease
MNNKQPKNGGYRAMYTALYPHILLYSLFMAICLFVYFWAGEANPKLAFNRNDFHWWQLITAHFVHYDFKHLSLNMSALLILQYIFPTKNKVLLNGLLLATVLIAMYLLVADLQFYIGFSALLYVIPGLATYHYIHEKRYDYVFLIVGIYLLYSIFSYFTVNISKGIIWKPSIPAHLLGFVAGFLSRWYSLNRGTKPPIKTK